jgi:methionine-rich copper-binding protein CopC
MPVFTLRGLRVLLAGAVTAIAIMVTALPAAAHTALKEANPKSGSTVEPPSEVVLTYTEAVKLPQVVVTDDKGTMYASGEAEATDNKVTQTLKGPLPNGDYTVGWRVVSVDGHPVKGSYKFTVKGASATATPTSASPATVATPASSPAASREESSGGSSGWLWIGLAAVVIAAIAGGLAWVRRPRAN